MPRVSRRSPPASWCSPLVRAGRGSPSGRGILLPRLSAQDMAFSGGRESSPPSLLHQLHGPPQRGPIAAKRRPQPCAHTTGRRAALPAPVRWWRYRQRQY
ncbi:hypothetical protein NDU88_004952 [Pleurodeles waltl]|uniref:Uncharacterized protein n=1 Tax=Pleurodeles waltl TaxID=8319 RepID=A0AAV7QDN0_PLEWA|nr:hypothetical protein NDU88_004952 [Pleurodeles waltl]